MFGFSKKNKVVFSIEKKNIASELKSKVNVDSILVRMEKLSPSQWKELKKLQGKYPVLYLKFRYGSSDTFLMLVYANGELVHVEWIVPSKKIRRRYPFVTKDSYTLISCLTSKDFRGLGIYPSQIQQVVKSDLPAKIYWIWADSTNTPSLKGIRKTGAIQKGQAVRWKWFYGLFSRVVFSSETIIKE